MDCLPFAGIIRSVATPPAAGGPGPPPGHETGIRKKVHLTTMVAPRSWRQLIGSGTLPANRIMLAVGQEEYDAHCVVQNGVR